MGIFYMTKEEAEERWIQANADWCCSCHICPPCSFCIEGFSLSLEEYLDLHFYGEDYTREQDYESDYDRAMRGI